MKVRLSCSLFVFAFLFLRYREALGCTITSAVGTHAPKKFCAGDLIFEDYFDTLDQTKWKHEVTMFGGGNNEFEWYVDDRRNSFIEDGKLHLKPTKTSDVFDEDFIYWGRVVIPEEECTRWEIHGCVREGEGPEGDAIINPIRSARISSVDSFSFKYGVLEIRAKLPAGDWLWPALWLKPKEEVYGPWPNSGEIDLMEARGNREYYSYHGTTHVGNQMVSSTVHFGAYGQNGYLKAKNFTHNSKGYNKDFHNYKMVWSDTSFEFYVDDVMSHKVEPGKGGFWEFGDLKGVNPWLGRELMAPFDQQFYVIMNLAVGGYFFPNHLENRPYPKPYDSNHYTRMAREFWEARNLWEPTWISDEVDFQIDYVKVWAL